MKTNIFKRCTSLVLALIICISSFAGLGTTAFAVGVKGKSYMVSFPRENDAKVDYSGTWGHKAQNLMNGWSLHESRYTTFFTMDDYGGKICYCIEPGTPAANGNEFTQKDESFWDNYPSQYNKTIECDYDRAMTYLTVSAEHGNQYATQLLYSIKFNHNWSAAMGSLRLLGQISHIIQNRLDDERKGKQSSIDRKLRRKIDEKKQAHGLKQG